MDDTTDRPLSGWCSMWDDYPNPDVPEGDSTPLATRASGTGGIGLPVAVEIEVKATNDARLYADAAKDSDMEKPAVATVKQTVWLTSKWMEP